MKINDNQIEQLYAFTRKHYVVHYDLQTELVDHLAMGIESQWADDPDLSFEDALQREFKKFGVFGFMDVVEKRQAALGKKYRGLMWKHIKEFFSIPKILLVICSTLFLFFSLKDLDYDSSYAIYTIVIIFVVYIFFSTYLYVQNNKHKKKEKVKVWMFEEMILQNGSGFGAAITPLYLLHFFVRFDETQYFSNIHPLYLFLVCFAFVMVCITMYVMTVEIPKRAKEYLHETYPEYRLVEQS